MDFDISKVKNVFLDEFIVQPVIETITMPATDNDPVPAAAPAVNERVASSTLFPALGLNQFKRPHNSPAGRGRNYNPNHQNQDLPVYPL